MRLASGLAVTLLAYLAVAYALLPGFWSERDRELPAEAMVTRTSDGRPGDPLNVGIVGTQSVLVSAMHAAGWFPADPVTLETSVGIVGSVVLDRPDEDAPVSPLFYLGRREDLAFEKPVGRSADRRQHVRFWQAGERDGTPLWLGSVTFDQGVGLSHYTGAVTHDIAPDIDAARDGLVDDLERAGQAAGTAMIEGVGPTTKGRNGEGDRYETDGRAEIVTLTAP
ncbi:LssY C-terminal domain-containing protein [Aureimonas mangrovi]|uniref:LssY C-terminal domain-containing protein n=1 Tax=Aureimonas mangrovi TaxID=2758041 RepID=UPI001FE2C968|nr:LssY C-terminal domain-containing protein [Aureimonas mangrovi]